MADIAWAAGIYEGEGYCGASRGLMLQVVQKDTWLLHRLKAMFGGRISRYGAETCSRWFVSGPRARGFLLTIFSFLSPRRRAQVRKAMASEGKRG